MKAIKRNSLYILQGNTVVGSSSVVQRNEDVTELWHMRLGHVGLRGLNELSKQNILCWDSIQTLDSCEYCILGKSKRVQFEIGKHSTSGPFDYAHSDIRGPTRTPTHEGGRYFMSIRYDYSRRLWVYVLKSKGEAYQKFKEWLKLMETKLNKKLKHLKTDNGLEYISD
ncbi:uncharacterized mitochondrial protein AtMg00300-like [Primulina eburnea]|uniref:uncharacterized mitochondrial protein AtMg00300-like n=1 Tax=Primulina eburnea TaxID=1245227 RepID=UPI003C6CB37C